MVKSQNLGLSLNGSSEQDMKMTFSSWRKSINGENYDSNMNIIDRVVGSIQSAVELLKVHSHAFSEITNKPTEYPPAAHDHSYNDLKDKPTIPSVSVVDSIITEIDYLHPLSITSFSVSPNLAEKGSTVSSEAFSFAVNRLGAVLTLNDQTVTGNSATRTDVLTADKTYTLKAALNGATKTATSTIKFVAPVYYGVSDSYALENATVLALTRVLTTSRSRTFTVNAASGQYILYALPVSLGTPTFKVGGFEGGFVLVGAFDFTNSSGYTERYNLYRTVNAGLGGTSVTVS